MFSETFFPEGGIAQGSPLSPILWKMFFQLYFQIDSPSVQGFEFIFMDDLSILLKSKDPNRLNAVAQKILTQLETEASKIGLLFDPTKTVAMPILKETAEHVELVFLERKLELVDNYKYLGMRISSGERNMEEDQLSSLSMARERVRLD